MEKLNYALSHTSVRVSSRRYERSPFREKYETPEIVHGVYAQRLYPLTSGETTRLRSIGL